LEAVATGCHDYDACWHPTPVPDGFPFGSPDVAVVWALVFVVSFIVFVQRLGRR